MRCVISGEPNNARDKKYTQQIGRGINFSSSLALRSEHIIMQTIGTRMSQVALNMFPNKHTHHHPFRKQNATIIVPYNNNYTLRST